MSLSRPCAGALPGPLSANQSCCGRVGLSFHAPGDRI